MKKKLPYTFVLILLAFALSGCSTKKNTALTRGYHKMTARYNVYFNAKQAYLTGLESIKKANADDFSEPIRVFESSNAEAAKSGASNMDRSIEKCEKCIKYHSIVKKPKKNPKKSKDPDYKAFMAKDEYNPVVQQAWLLMGIAQYHKSDYMAAIATLSYCSRHFPENRDVYTYSRLYMARCYTDLGWFYEAEDVLNKLGENDFVPKTTRMFVLVRADLLMEQERYAEALPYLLQAIEDSRGDRKARMLYIYGQALEELGRSGEAYTAYEICIDKNPPAAMEFNAFMSMARCYQGSDAGEVLARLQRLLKKQSNEQYKDQIYYAMGQLYARGGDEAKAEEYYKLAVSSSTRNGIDKAKALLALGEMNMEKRRFREAQPQYGEAVPLLPLDYENYEQIAALSDNLNAVAENMAVVELEDSLQALAALPEDERVEKLQKTIEEEKKREEEILRRMEEEQRLQDIKDQNAALGQNVALGGTADQSWYFYNPTLVARGKLQFRKDWGGRSLEDDWRRSDKMGSYLFADEEGEDADTLMTEGGEPVQAVMTREDSLAGGDRKLADYLRSVPSTPERIAQSDKRIETALYNLVVVSENDLKDRELAEESLRELERRFPQSEYLPEAYYRLYGLCSRQGSSDADTYKNAILQRYSDSQYAKLITYGAGAPSDDREQKIENLYRETYAAFVEGDSYAVAKNAAEAREKYPDAALMPKFEFLDIVSHGKQDGPETFRKRLSELVEKYPESEISPVARDMIALSGQGREVQQTNTTAENISESREQKLVSRREFEENLQKAGFVYDPDDRHLFVVMLRGSEKQRNDLLFAIATYNFTRFLIRDFDFELRPLAAGEYCVAVKGLENLDEALWYQETLLADREIQAALSGADYRAFAISQENFKAVYDKESAEKYMEFYRENNLQIKEDDVIRALEENVGFVSADGKSAVQEQAKP